MNEETQITLQNKVNELSEKIYYFLKPRDDKEIEVVADILADHVRSYVLSISDRKYLNDDDFIADVIEIILSKLIHNRLKVGYLNKFRTGNNHVLHTTFVEPEPLKDVLSTLMRKQKDNSKVEENRPKYECNFNIFSTAYQTHNNNKCTYNDKPNRFTTMHQPEDDLPPVYTIPNDPLQSLLTHDQSYRDYHQPVFTQKEKTNFFER